MSLLANLFQKLIILNELWLIHRSIISVRHIHHVEKPKSGCGKAYQRILHYPEESTVKPLEITNLDERYLVTGRLVTKSIDEDKHKYHWIKREGFVDSAPQEEREIKIIKDDCRTSSVSLIECGEKLKYSMLIPRTTKTAHEGYAYPLGTDTDTLTRNVGMRPGFLTQAVGTYANIGRRIANQKVEYCRHQYSKCSAGGKDNLTAVLYKIEDLKLEQRPIPKIKRNEVLLQMESVGICGSDVHYLVHGRIGDFVVKKPMIIGHEGSGTVVKVGEKVTNLKIGDRVAIEPGIPCRTCNFCKDGRYHLCHGMKFCATPPYHGNLTRFYAHAADFCFKLPAHVSLDEGALLEPLAVGVHACKLGKVGFGSTVLILGAGPIGLVSLLTAKAMGATNIVITDIQKFRLDVAKSLGANHTIQIKKGDKDETLICKIKDLFCGEPTVTLECVGADQSIRLAIQATKSGGRAILVGMGAPLVKVPLINAVIKEVYTIGSFRYANDYPTALEMVASGKVKVKSLITHHFSIKDTNKAFDVAKTGKGNPIKVMIHANPKWKPKSKC